MLHVNHISIKKNSTLNVWGEGGKEGRVNYQGVIIKGKEVYVIQFALQMYGVISCSLWPPQNDFVLLGKVRMVPLLSKKVLTFGSNEDDKGYVTSKPSEPDPLWQSPGTDWQPSLRLLVGTCLEA